MSVIRCCKADLATQGDFILDLLNQYACDPLGGAETLPEYTRRNLLPEIEKRPDLVVPFLAFVDDEPAGLAICIVGFSTFACKPLLNIHDFVTSSAHRRKGVATALLTYVEEYARAHECCKITLECLSGNVTAKSVYQNFGFKPYELSPEYGPATFYHKYIKS
jgi:GNAT superfamily N-acetyltransferase